MLFAGCDLHKQTITICVVNQIRTVILRKTLACADEEAAGWHCCSFKCVPLACQCEW